MIYYLVNKLKSFIFEVLFLNMTYNIYKKNYKI